MSKEIAPKQTSPLSDGVDENFSREIQVHQLELEALLRMHPSRQDFEKIWVVRDRIAGLTKAVNEKAASRAREQQRIRLAAQAQKEREDAEHHAMQEQDRLRVEKLRLAEKRRRAASALITSKLLSACTDCDDGKVKVECTACAGTGQGAPRLTESTVTAVCSDRRATCAHCGGTGVMQAKARALTTSCAKCNGDREVVVPCYLCQGSRVVSFGTKPFSVPEDIQDLVLSILYKGR
jgi:DnaJ-class molecular chaperone